MMPRSDDRERRRPPRPPFSPQRDFATSSGCTSFALFHVDGNPRARGGGAWCPSAPSSWGRPSPDGGTSPPLLPARAIVSPCRSCVRIGHSFPFPWVGRGATPISGVMEFAGAASRRRPRRKRTRIGMTSLSSMVRRLIVLSLSPPRPIRSSRDNTANIVRNHGPRKAHPHRLP